MKKQMKIIHPWSICIEYSSPVRTSHMLVPALAEEVIRIYGGKFHRIDEKIILEKNLELAIAYFKKAECPLAFEPQDVFYEKILEVLEILKEKESKKTRRSY